MKPSITLRTPGSAGLLPLVVVLMLASSLTAPSGPQNKNSVSDPPALAPARTPISASAVWVPQPDFFRTAHAACDANPANSIDECFILQMILARAPADAVQFSHRLYGENGGEFGLMLRFQKLGPVDMAKVYYPLRKVGEFAVGSRNVALLLVNGDPSIIDVDDLKKLDIQAREHGVKAKVEYDDRF